MFGIDLLKDAILAKAGIDRHSIEGTFSARRRHLTALMQVSEALTRCQQQLEDPACMALVAEELRLSQQHLGEITGQVTADHLLGEIFATFCIGK